MASQAKDSEEAKEALLRRTLREIIHGYSKVSITPASGSAMYDANVPVKTCFAKHFNLFDQLELDDLYDAAFDKAREKGLPTRKESLAQLEESGDWTAEDEKHYESRLAYSRGLEQTVKKLTIPSQIAIVKESLDKVLKEVEEKGKEKKSLMGTTCEDYALGQLNTKTILFTLHSDKECKKKLFSNEDADYLDNTDVASLILGYNEGTKNVTIENIKLLSISNIFMSYFSLVEEAPHEFFKNKEIYDLTFYQLNLLTYAKVLRSIIKHTDPPPNIKDDPDKLLEWSEKGEKARELLQKSTESDGFSVVGATSEDYKEMGISREGQTIHDLAKEKSGKSKGGFKGGAKGQQEGSLGIMDFIGD